MGLLLKAIVLPANVQDREGAQLLLGECWGLFPLLQLIWADLGYGGKNLGDWVKVVLGTTLEIVKHWWAGTPELRVPKGRPQPSHPKGFQVLPRRWVVERTFAWMGRKRRLSKDYEELPESEETWLYLAMICLMTKRLARPP